LLECSKYPKILLAVQNAVATWAGKAHRLTGAQPQNLANIVFTTILKHKLGMANEEANGSSSARTEQGKKKEGRRERIQREFVIKLSVQINPIYNRHFRLFLTNNVFAELMPFSFWNPEFVFVLHNIS